LEFGFLTSAPSPTIEIVVARTRNGVIGNDNAMPWHLPADLRFFKALTMGHPILMGRKTAEAIGRSLPGRVNLVMSRQAHLELAGYTLVHSPEEALHWAQVNHSEKLFVIGGAEIYARFLPLTHILHITEIHTELEGDTRFPELDPAHWLCVESVDHPADEKNAFDLQFTRWVKRPAN
jgi:dihydrofolate reductase